MRVAAAAALLLLGSACAATAPRPGEGAGESAPAQGVRGRLTRQGRPLAGAVVYAYRRASAGFLGPADFASDPSGPDGAYVLDLVEGSYHLVARKRVSGADAGPLLPGDLRGEHPGNPVAVAPGRFTVADLELEEARDLMRTRGPAPGASDTGIRGRILGADGLPAAWVFAIAYTTADMRRIPDFASALTAADGRYEIRLPRGGRYYVGARARIRERPAPGEPYGLYGGSADHGVAVPDGAFVEGVDILLGVFRGGE